MLLNNHMALTYTEVCGFQILAILSTAIVTNQTFHLG